MSNTVITTGSHPKLQWPGISALFGITYDQHSKEYPKIFDMETDSRGWVEDVETTGFGLAPVKDQNGSIIYVGHTQGKVQRYTHVAYALGFIVTREEIDDNQYPQLAAKRSKALAFSFAQTKENVAANVLNRAFNASYTFADGVALGSASHTSVAGTYSNILSTAADLSETSLEDMCIQIMNATDAQGLKISIMPKRLIIPTALAFEAQRILKSSGQSGTANNDMNVLKSMGIVPEIAVNHYLTDTDAWFIKTNCPDGLKGYQRVALGALQQDNDFDTENAKAKNYERYSFGITDPRGVYCTPGA